MQSIWGLKQHSLLIFNCLILQCLCQNEVYRWGAWSSYPFSCSVTCGTGIKCKVRNCLDHLGNVQKFPDLCRDPEQADSEPQLCTSCTMQARCPRLPGWSSWNSWSSCNPIEQKEIKDFSTCQAGYRIRFRSCDNPPPDPPPAGIPCSGPNQAVTNCTYNCEDSEAVADKKTSTKIEQLVNHDFQANLHMFNQVIRTKVKNFIQFSCETLAYDTAKLMVSKTPLKRGNKHAQTRGLTIRWFKNGEPVKLHKVQTGIKSFWLKRKRRNKFDDLLWDEQERWSNLYPMSNIYAEDKYLIFPSVQWGDQGFYTCELTVKDRKWITKFYTLIVNGISYMAEMPDPFYLHSNLGHRHALHRVSIWLDGAQVVWKLNGVEQSRGLAERLDRRIQLIPHLNLTHQGIWTCYLVLPSPGTRNSPWAPWSGYFLINEFRLYVSYSPFSLWRLAEFPLATRTMRNWSVGFAVLNLALVGLLVINIWASYKWIVRTLTTKQKKAIVQEVVDNECRLLLVARRRAHLNKHRLLPLVIKEQQRLDRVNRFLIDRFLGDYLVRRTITRFPKKMHLTNLLYNATVVDRDLEDDYGPIYEPDSEVHQDYHKPQEDEDEWDMNRAGDWKEAPWSPRGYNTSRQGMGYAFQLVDRTFPNDDRPRQDEANHNLEQPQKQRGVRFDLARSKRDNSKSKPEVILLKPMPRLHGLESTTTDQERRATITLRRDSVGQIFREEE